MLTRCWSWFMMVCALVASIAPAASAQCNPQWLPNGPGQEMEGNISCVITFDPDGAGPQASLLVVGGSSLNLRGLGVHKILAFDGVVWRALEVPGSAVGTVRCLSVYNGQLVVGGEFDSIGGIAAKNIAKWNGTTWNALGGGVFSPAGLPDEVLSLVVSNGFLFAGGRFTSAGSGFAANGIARWDGANWASIGGIGAGGFVLAMVEFQGQLYVGGSFSSAGGVAATNLARYSLTTGVWTAFGNPNASVSALAQFTGIAASTQRLYVGGSFTSIGGVAATGAARYAPFTQTWSAMGTPPGRTVCTGFFVRTTDFAAIITAVWSGAGMPRQAFMLSGTTWSNINGVPLDNVEVIGFSGGQYVLGTAAANTTSRVYQWNGSLWDPVGKRGSYGSAITSLALDDSSGDVIAGGRNFQFDGTTTEAFVARRTAATGNWTRLSGNLGVALSPQATINAVAVRPNGEIFAGGNVSGSAGYIARWNGSAWTSVGTGVNGSVNAMLTRANGDLIVGGAFTQAGGITVNGIARWNGTAWSPLAEGMQFGGVVYALTELSNGDIIAGGRFNVAGTLLASNVARWNGTAWSPLGAGVNRTVFSLTPSPTGGVYVGGTFTTAGGIPANAVALWNGVSWTAFAPLYDGAGILDVHVLPQGSLLVGGVFASGTIPSNYMLRWNGTSWVAMDGGASGAVYALLSLPDGTVAVGGEFVTVGGDVSSCFARIATQGCGGCDSIDFNNNTVFPEDADVIDFFTVLAGGECATCNDIDFNNNGVFPEDQDVIDFFTVLAGGECGA